MILRDTASFTGRVPFPRGEGCVQLSIITRGKAIRRMKPVTDPVISHSESVHASVRIFLTGSVR